MLMVININLIIIIMWMVCYGKQYFLDYQIRGYAAKDLKLSMFYLTKLTLKKGHKALRENRYVSR